MDSGGKMIPRAVEKAKGPAVILALGTANPPNCFNQADYAEYYFRVTKSEHMTELKDRFKRICEKSTVEKRYMHITEDILQDNPNLCTHRIPSLSTRQKILAAEIPRLGQEAALKALCQWNQPISKITHLIVSAVQGIELPGADRRIASLLRLNATVKRTMLYHHGCYASATALRLAKDSAENDTAARVLVVCSDLTVGSFRGPDEENIANLQTQAMLSDGAAAAIVGADVDIGVEKPLFKIISGAQLSIPDSENVVGAFVDEYGFWAVSNRHIGEIVSNNMEECLNAAFGAAGMKMVDWNAIFWSLQGTVVPIIDGVEQKLKLGKTKLRFSRKVLRENGYLMSASSLFVLEEIMKSSIQEEKSTTGDGFEFGVLVGFGAGVTIEAIVLESMSI